MDLMTLMNLMMGLVQDIMTMVNILLEGAQGPLEEHLGVMILQVGIFPFLEGIHLLVITLEDMIPGDIMDFHLVILDFLEEMEDLLLDPLVLLETQEEEFLFIFLTLILGLNHHHFSNSLGLLKSNIFGMGTLLLLSLR